MGDGEGESGEIVVGLDEPQEIEFEAHEMVRNSPSQNMSFHHQYKRSKWAARSTRDHRSEHGEAPEEEKEE